MDKKGDLSINMIVIAAIAMIILVVISVLIFRSGGILNESQTCSAIGGVCVDDTYYKSCSDYANDMWLENTYTKHPTAACEENTFCCIPLKR